MKSFKENIKNYVFEKCSNKIYLRLENNTLWVSHPLKKLKESYLDFQDMHERKNYLIWREKNNFFYAISCEDSETKLIAWSMITGELIFENILIG